MSDHQDLEPDDSGERSVLTLIRDLQNGAISAASLSIKDRRLCVEHLTAEGYSVAEVAQVLKSTDRTIKRDRAAIRQSHAIEASPELANEMVGNLLREADTSIARIRRATRGTDVPPVVKVEAERNCWAITRELVQSLQRLGYLPTAPQVMHGQMTHQFDNLISDTPGYSELSEELARLEVIFNQNTQGGSVMLSDIHVVKDTVTRMALSQQVQHLRAQSAESRSGVPASDIPQEPEQRGEGDTDGE